MNPTAKLIKTARIKRDNRIAEMQEKLIAATKCLEAIQPALLSPGLQSYVNLTLAKIKDTSVQPITLPDRSELDRLKEENEHMKMVLEIKDK